MRTAGGLTSIFVVGALVVLAGGVRAETYTAVVPLTPGAEIVGPNDPVPPAGATGTTVLTLTVNRDAQGAITGGTVNFLTNFLFNTPVTITGHHIHEREATANGPVVVNPSLNGVQTGFPNGAGQLNLNVAVTNVELLKRLLTKPAGFYVNLHTNLNPAGAIRGQLVAWRETLATTVLMSPLNEVDPITNVDAFGYGTITVNPVRNEAGVVTSGTVTFTISFSLPAPATISGLHIHRGPAGVNGPVLINTGINATTARVESPSGRGTVNYVVPVTSGAALDAMKDMLVNPQNYYVNLHTTTPPFPGGLIRGQLTTFGAPPILTTATDYVLQTGGSNTLTLTGAGLDGSMMALINGVPALTLYDSVSNTLTVSVPANLQSTPGLLQVQAVRGNGLRSAPLTLVVAPRESINARPVTSVDAARFGPSIAPDSIASGFGSDLATQNASAPPNATNTLPTSLDGTTVYVNGVQAPLFFVSPAQINYLVPAATLPGTGHVVVVARTGTVSQGEVVVDRVAPGIFTTKRDGTGAPAALATPPTGNAFVVGNPDGSPVPLDVNTAVALFGTGWRFASAAPTLRIGETNVPVSFAGAQGTFAGLDQANFTIPAALAGRGEVDAVLTFDGKPSNTVKLRIK